MVDPRRAFGAPIVLRGGVPTRILAQTACVEDPIQQTAQWYEVEAQEGDWVVISADPRISRGKATKRAWHESGLTAFLFGDGFAPKKFWVQASEVVRLRPPIVLKARECAPGTGFALHYHSEKMTEIYTPEGLAV